MREFAKYIIESLKVFFGTFFEEPESYEWGSDEGITQLGWVLFGIVVVTVLSPFIIYFFVR